MDTRGNNSSRHSRTVSSSWRSKTRSEQWSQHCSSSAESGPLKGPGTVNCSREPRAVIASYAASTACWSAHSVYRRRWNRLANRQKNRDNLSSGANAVAYSIYAVGLRSRRSALKPSPNYRRPTGWRAFSPSSKRLRLIRILSLSSYNANARSVT